MPADLGGIKQELSLAAADRGAGVPAKPDAPPAVPIAPLADQLRPSRRRPGGGGLAVLGDGRARQASSGMAQAIAGSRAGSAGNHHVFPARRAHNVPLDMPKAPALARPGPAFLVAGYPRGSWASAASSPGSARSAARWADLARSHRPASAAAHTASQARALNKASLVASRCPPCGGPAGPHPSAHRASCPATGGSEPLAACLVPGFVIPGCPPPGPGQGQSRRRPGTSRRTPASRTAVRARRRRHSRKPPRPGPHHAPQPQAQAQHLAYLTPGHPFGPGVLDVLADLM